MDVGGSVQHMSAATELKPEPEPEVALRALNAEATKLRKRHDEITAECITLRQKLHQMVERTSGFTKSADLSAGANEDAAEVAELEAEHAARTAEKLRALEAERLDALSRNEHLTSVGSLDDERDRIAKLQLIFDSIAEVCLGRLMTLDDA